MIMTIIQMNSSRLSIMFLFTTIKTIQIAIVHKGQHNKEMIK